MRGRREEGDATVVRGTEDPFALRANTAKTQVDTKKGGERRNTHSYLLVYNA